MVSKASNEACQFGILYRDFLFRIVDLEILSSGGEIKRLLIQFTAMLAAFSFVLTIWFVPMISLSIMSHDRLLVALLPLEEFLIASTMGTTGLFCLLAWNNVLPDQTDCLILGLLPLRTRTIFMARTAALVTALGVSIIATNIFTGLTIPFFIGGIRTVFAWWLAMAGAGLAVAGGLLALQGLLAQVLSYRSFLRVSSWAQLAAFLTVLGVYFLKPAHYPPSSWFLALFQLLNAPTPDLVRPAVRALWSVLLPLAVAAITFALGYQRNLRRIVEQPDIAPVDRTRPATRLGDFLVAKLFRQSIDRAIILFTARTIARSRQHRLLLAAYVGIGLAFALAYARDLLHSPESFDLRHNDLEWDQVNSPFLIAGLVLLFFAIIGARVLFAIPISLRANWIFGVTAVNTPAAYVAAVRKALYAVTAIPVWMTATIAYFAIWQARSAAEHVIVLVILGILLVERSLYRFHKIPFACSYLPGKANLHVRLGAGAIVFLLATNQGVRVEYWAMQRLLRFAIFAFVLGALALLTHFRTSSQPIPRLEFEDLPRAELLSLGLTGAEQPDLAMRKIDRTGE